MYYIYNLGKLPDTKAVKGVAGVFILMERCRMASSTIQ